VVGSNLSSVALGLGEKEGIDRLLSRGGFLIGSTRLA